MLYLVFLSNVCDIYVCYMLNKITYLLTYRIMALAITALVFAVGVTNYNFPLKIHPYLHYIGVDLHLHRVHFPCIG